MAKVFIVGTKIDVALLDKLDTVVEAEGVNRSEWLRGAIVYAITHMPRGFAATLSENDPNQIHAGRTNSRGNGASK